MLAGSLMLALRPSIGRAEVAPAGRNAVVPGDVRALDVAATDLFDAAEAGNWDDAALALRRVRSIAPGVSGLESAYLAAGGGIDHFIEVVDNLNGDAIEAGTALSTKDRPWLVSCADRIASRAGELSQPFDARTGTVVPRFDTLLFLVRRMRRALVWRDEGGLIDAHHAFTRLWSKLRPELAGQQAAGADAVERALADVGQPPTRNQLKQLYKATQALGAATA
ncbi:MAG: hypothetical protein ABI364_04565 [Caldimonas sp.]